MAELDGVGIATGFAADAELDPGAGLVVLLASDLHEFADAGERFRRMVTALRGISILMRLSD
jgi:hypothetical protein